MPGGGAIFFFLGSASRGRLSPQPSYTYRRRNEFKAGGGNGGQF